MSVGLTEGSQEAGVLAESAAGHDSAAFVADRGLTPTGSDSKADNVDATGSAPSMANAASGGTELSVAEGLLLMAAFGCRRKEMGVTRAR